MKKDKTYETAVRRTFYLDGEVDKKLNQLAGLRQYHGEKAANPSRIANAILSRELDKELKKQLAAPAA